MKNDLEARVLERINETKAQKATELDLSHLGLTMLPPEIGSLTALRKLSLLNNQLTTLPPEIGALTSLQELRLDNNLLTAVPPTISSLNALQRLDLDQNQLTALPEAIGSLTALRQLYLHCNRLTMLPPAIGRLTELQKLFLSQNQLTTLPPEIGSLTALQSLWLHRNHLATLPPELQGCAFLQELFLHDNVCLQIPASILGPTFVDVHGYPQEQRKQAARPVDILNYYFSRRAAAAQGTLQSVNELKVMLVGRGGAGKSSLRRFFLNEPHNVNEPETAGIALDVFPLPCHGRSIQVHLWDFAGQEITRTASVFSYRRLYLHSGAGSPL